MPLPPSERLGRALPASLEAWVLGCLEKDPQKRPRSAADAASHLDACAIDDAWSVERARAWWAGRGRAIAAENRATVTPSAETRSRSVVESGVAGGGRR
jgi:hypothetical protein